MVKQSNNNLIPTTHHYGAQKFYTGGKFQLVNTSLDRITHLDNNESQSEIKK